MNITYKSSENSNLDTFYCFRIYNIFKYLDCDSTYILCLLFIIALYCIKVLFECWLLESEWDLRYERTHVIETKKRNPKLMLSFYTLRVIVFIFLLIFWSFIDRRRNMISILLPWTGWILLMAFPLPHHFT